MESWWQLIFAFSLWRFVTRPTTGVGDQCTLAIHYRDHDTSLHNPFPTVIAHTEIVDSLSRQAALLEICMVLIEIFKCKWKGGIDQRFWCRWYSWRHLFIGRFCKGWYRSSLRRAGNALGFLAVDTKPVCN